MYTVGTWRGGRRSLLDRLYLLPQWAEGPDTWRLLGGMLPVDCAWLLVGTDCSSLTATGRAFGGCSVLDGAFPAGGRVGGLCR